MSAEFVKGMIGDKGQELLGGTIGTMLSKEICESIRKEFKGPLLAKFEGLLTTASEELKGEFLNAKLEEAINAIEIKELNITSGGGSKIIGGIPNPVPTEVPASVPTEVPTSKLPEFSVFSKLVKSATSGLAPDAKEITGGLNNALDETMVKEMLQTGITNLINYLTGDGKDELVRMFIGILRERINDNYKNNPGAFQEVIKTAISRKCGEQQADAATLANIENEGYDEGNEGYAKENNLRPLENAEGGGKSKKRTRTTRKIKKI